MLQVESELLHLEFLWILTSFQNHLTEQKVLDLQNKVRSDYAEDVHISLFQKEKMGKVFLPS